MPDFTQQNEPKPTPEKHVYTELEYTAANNSLLSKIEAHLQSIRSMLTFFVVLAVIGIIVQGCSLLSLL